MELKKFLVIPFFFSTLLTYSQYRNFNTCDWGGDKYYFYKNYVIRSGDIHVNGVPINPYYYFQFYGMEIPFTAGGNEYDYNRDYDTVIIKDDEFEMVKHLVPKKRNYILNVRYYNNSQEYILEVFNINLVYCFKELIEYINKYGLEDYYEVINNLEIEDLAKLRNLLFALHNYKFNNIYWINYFKEYLGYNNGVLNSEESQNQFTSEEKKLLEYIIQVERKN